MSLTFQELGLRPELQQAVAELGFVEPTPVQQQTIPVLLKEHRDMVALAQTGTGKTASFGLPMLHLLDENSRSTQGIVICPTRELCLQITNDLKKFSKYMKKVNVTAVYGGASISQQEREIRRGTQIIVATPGRMMDLMERGIIRLEEVMIAVLDEADEMLNMGFQEDIEHILSRTPDHKLTWLFSATMPNEVARISKRFLNNQIEITVGKKNSGADNLAHKYYVVKEKDRYAALKRIIDFHPDIFGLIFCRTKHGTRTVADKLIKDGYNCEALHGDLSQSMRDSVMMKFRERTIKLLVATDVAARGIDVSEITHVIHYELPDDPENYTHRSGRTARAGKSGQSLCLVNTREVRRIKELERITNKKFEADSIPQPREVCEVQLLALLDRMMGTGVNEKDIRPYLPKIFERFEKFSKEEVITRFVSAEFNRFLDYYRHAGDLNAQAGEREDYGKGRGEGKWKKGEDGDRSGGHRGQPEKGYQRLFVNIGFSEGVNKGKLVRLICDMAGVTSRELGRIDIKDDFSFIEVKEHSAARIFKSLSGARVEGRKWRVEHAGAGSSGGGFKKGNSSGGGGYKGGRNDKKRKRNFKF